MAEEDFGLNMERLIARRVPGMTLEQCFYTHPAVFARDFERIVSKQWLLVDNESRVPQVGDFLTYRLEEFTC